MSGRRYGNESLAGGRMRGGSIRRRERLKKYFTESLPKSERIDRMIMEMYRKMPEVESGRAVLLTESYRRTENEPMIIRRAKAFEHVLKHLPVVIRDDELIVGSSTLAPRGCQTFPEFSFEWL